MSLDDLNLDNYDPTKPLQPSYQQPTQTATPDQQTPDLPTEENPVVSFARNLPTTIARTAVQPVEFIGKTANTVGDFMARSRLGQFVSRAWGAGHYDPNAKTDLNITVPFQSTPLIDTKKFDTFTQFAGSGAEAGLNVFLAMTGAGGAARNIAAGGAKAAVKAAAAQGGRSVARNLAKAALKDFGIGAGYGVAIQAQGEGGTVGDYVKSAAIGGVLGAALPPVFGKTMKVLGGGVRAFKGAAGEVIEKTATNLESRVAAGVKEAESGLRYRQGNQGAAASLGERLTVSGAEALRSMQRIPDVLQTKFLDRYHPIAVFQKAVNKLTGLNLDLQDAVQAAQGKGVGIARSRWEHDYKPMAQGYGKDWQYVKEMSHYLDDLDRLHNGNTITGDKQMSDTLAAVENLKSTLGPERVAKVQQGVKDLQGFLARELDDAVASGRVSPEQAAMYRSAHPNYIPHSVVDFLAKDEGGNLNAPTQARSGSFSLTKSGIDKAQGSARQIEDIDKSVERMLYRQHVLNQKNIVDNAISSAGQKAGLITLNRSAETVTARIKAAEDLSALVKQNNADTGVVQSIKGQEKSIAQDINATAKAKPPTTFTDVRLSDKLKATGDELSAVLDQAQTMAADLEPSSSINRVLDKVRSREQQIATLKEKVAGRQSKFNEKQAASVESSASEINQLRDDRKALEAAINGRREDVNALRQELAGLQDTKMKPVDVPAGKQKLSYFKNGIREEALVPEDVGNALRNLDPDAATTLMQWVGNSRIKKALVLGPANVIRKLTTGINPMFGLVTNPLRDIQTTAITAPVNASDLAHAASRFTGKGLIRTMFPKLSNIEVDNMYRAAMESGAFSSSIFQGDVTGDVSKATSSWGRRLKNPVNMIENAGRALEENTRLAVFTNLIRNGMSVEAASKAARNATVDFTKSGTLLRQLNQVIPFLNARVQGFANMTKVAGENPELFGRRVLWNAAAPAALIYAHNQKFQSYQNIPDYEKQRYWTVMIGENPGYDTKGRPIMVPHYLKIPKGEVQQAVGMVVDRIFDHGNKQFPDTTSQFLAKFVANVNPVTGGGGGGLSSVIPLPAGVQQLAELGFNKNYYTQQQIVPEFTKLGGHSFRTKELPPKYQYNPDTTSAIAVKLGQSIGVSPAQVDYLLKTGVLNDLTKVTNVKFDSRKSFYENLSNLPFLRTVFGSRSSGLVQDQQQFMQQMKKDYNQEALDGFFQNVPQ